MSDQQQQHPGEPALLAGAGGGTGLVLSGPSAGRLPEVAWVGVVPDGLSAPGASRFATDAVACARAADRGSLLPEEASGLRIRPGLAGYRISPGGRSTGQDWAPMFAPESFGLCDVPAPALTGWRLTAADEHARLHLSTEIQAVAGGLLRIRHTLANNGDTSYVVHHLDVTVPVTGGGEFLTDFTGRANAERVIQTRPMAQGLVLREGRDGKPGPDSPYVMLASGDRPSFGSGSVLGVHVAWSGNCRYLTERSMSGTTRIGGGEALLPGEVALPPGGSYCTPWLYVAASTRGLDGIAHAFHRFCRSLPAHPHTPRPVNFNAWEARYFDLSYNALAGLADSAARIGVERFVVDDGWFGARRNDSAGLGDWRVSPDVFPDGLRVLSDRVHELGMQFGLWFEPEMVNPDSDLFRAHPDWILRTGDRFPAASRNQFALDLGRAEVRDQLSGAVSRVLRECAVDYVKWDHNRPLDNAGSGLRDGAPGVHANTLGFYELVDRLRAEFPAIEWESCSGGGSRIDLEVVARFQRIWASDRTDAISRLEIQRWTAQLLPLEYIGSHVSATRNHQTARILPLALRCAVAMFGHFGIEWDIAGCTPEELAELAAWIGAYKRHRALLHSGRLVRIDTHDPHLYQQAVVAEDGREFIAVAARTEESFQPGPNLLVPGLRPAAAYQVRLVGGRCEDPWPAPGAAGSLELCGAAMAAIGIPAAVGRPHDVIVVHGRVAEGRAS